MISLIDTSIHFGRCASAKIILDRANLRIETRDRVGILARTGSGKTSIARVLAGQTKANSGFVQRTGTISWPLAFSAALHPQLTASQNIRNVAGLYNLDPVDLEVRVQAFSELGRSFYQPVGDLAPGLRGQLAIGLSLSVDFDMYLADELSANGSRDFQDKCESAIRDRLEVAGFVLLTRHIRTIERYCERFVVLSGARLIECNDAAQASEILAFEQEKDELLDAAL